MSANHHTNRPALIRTVNLATRNATRPQTKRREAYWTTRRINRMLDGWKEYAIEFYAQEYDENFSRAELDEPRQESPAAVWEPFPL